MSELVRYGFSTAQAQQQADVWLKNNLTELSARTQSEKDLADYRGRIAESAGESEMARSIKLLQEKNIGDIREKAFTPELYRELSSPTIGMAKTAEMFSPDFQARLGMKIPPEQAEALKARVTAGAAMGKQALGPLAGDITNEHLSVMFRDNPKMAMETIKTILDQARTQKVAELEAARIEMEKGRTAQMGKKGAVVATEKNVWFRDVFLPDYDKAQENLQKQKGAYLLQSDSLINEKTDPVLVDIAAKFELLKDIRTRAKEVGGLTPEIEAKFKAMVPQAPMEIPGIKPTPSLGQLPVTQQSAIKDQYGWVIGQTIPVTAGPDQGIWEYIGNNQWKQKK
jgi:hypothetical protein